MIDFLKKNWVTVLIVLATLILAGVAVFTALRLYQLRQESVAPNVPSSQPAAAGPTQACTMTFALASGSPSPSPSGSSSPSPSGSATPTPSGSPTPTPSTPPLSCGDACSSNSDCTNNMVCSNGLCRNPSCLNSTNCICGTTSPTPTATTTVSTSTPAPELPNSGTGTPALIGISAGILLLLTAFILAL